ncbi:unnamed protein product [Eretmochelys imbricata]
MGANPPIRYPQFRINGKTAQNLEREVKDMLSLEVILPFNSPWASPVGLVPKKDGSIWFCGDYQKLKAITMSDAYPRPRPGEILDKLRGVENLALTYIEDIWVFSQTWEEHVSQVKRVLGCLKEAGLTVKAGRCKVGMGEVSYLGHKVGSGCPSPELAKVKMGALNKERPNSSPPDWSAGRRPDPSLNPRVFGVEIGHWPHKPSQMQPASAIEHTRPKGGRETGRA